MYHEWEEQICGNVSAFLEVNADMTAWEGCENLVNTHLNKCTKG